MGNGEVTVGLRGAYFSAQRVTAKDAAKFVKTTTVMMVIGHGVPFGKPYSHFLPKPGTLTVSKAETSRGRHWSPATHRWIDVRGCASLGDLHADGVVLVRVLRCACRIHP